MTDYSLSLGRATAERFTIESFAAGEDRITLAGMIHGPSGGAPTVPLWTVRDQFCGYGPPALDEPWVPFVFGRVPDLSGYVRPIRVSSDGFGKSLSDEDVPQKVQLELERFPGGWQTPRQELSVRGTVRANAHSRTIANSIPWWCPGVSVYDLDRRGAITEGPVSLTGAEGALPIFHDSTTPSSYKSWPSWVVDPEDYYLGAARLEVSDDNGATWRVVTGRQVPNRATYWRLSNTLMRITARTTSGKTELSVQWYQSGAWTTARVLRLTQDSSWTDLTRAPASLTVLSNSAAQVSIRLGLSSASSYDRLYLDLLLRRGAQYVEGYLSEEQNTSGTDYGIECDTNTAATSVITNAAWRSTSGPPYLVAGSTVVGASDLTNGKLRTTGPPWQFVIGAAAATGTAVTQASGLVNQWLAAMEWTQRVVAA